MGYIIECKTMQATAVKVVADTLNSLLRDINLTFTPFYIENAVSDSESDNSDDEESVNEEKKIGGVIILHDISPIFQSTVYTVSTSFTAKLLVFVPL